MLRSNHLKKHQEVLVKISLFELFNLSNEQFQGEVHGITLVLINKNSV